jgi:hypothetical protein
MRRPRTHPVVELFSDGEILDSYALYRWGAFRRPMEFPFRRLRTYRDHIELRWPNRDQPPRAILLERTRCLDAERTWFLCYKCGRRCARLYVSSIDVACRKCAGLQFTSQRQRRATRLKTRANKIRWQLWSEGEKIIRPRFMHQKTYRQHMHALQRIEQAIRTGSRLSSPRYRRQRERDEYGQYCELSDDLGLESEMRQDFESSR